MAFDPRHMARGPVDLHGVEAAPLADDGGDEELFDVYIRRSCPSTEFPHLVRVSSGSRPPHPALWVQVPEEELERSQTVQCTACNRVLLLARDQAEEFCAEVSPEQVC